MNVPETKAQAKILKALRRIVAKEGRAVTIKELGLATGTAPSTVWMHLNHLERQGLVRRGNRGILPAQAGEDRYTQGWLAACAHLRREVMRELEERHASPATIGAVQATINCAESAVKP